MSTRSWSRSTVPVRLSWSAWSQGDTDAVRSVASATTALAPEPSRTEMTSPADTWYDGMFTFLPLTVKWLCRTSWRPCDREAEPVDDVVEPQLEHAQEVLAGDAAAPAGLGVVAAELRLQHAVVAAHL